MFTSESRLGNGLHSPMPWPSPPAIPLRILCADDDPVIRLLTHTVLTRLGHRVTCTRDGLEAWTELAARPEGYDAVVTDHDMPHLTGLALVQRLRDSGFAGRIVVISGSIDPTLEASYRALAVDAILVKPFSNDALLAAVQSPRRG